MAVIKDPLRPAQPQTIDSTAEQAWYVSMEEGVKGMERESEREVVFE